MNPTAVSIAPPSSVQLAVRLANTGVLIALVNSLWTFFHLRPVPWIVFGSAMFAYGLSWFLIAQMANGRNWARLTFLIMFLLGIPLAILMLIVEPSILQKIITGGLLLLRAIALMLAFEPEASAWFKKQSASPPSAPSPPLPIARRAAVRPPPEYDY